VSHNLLIIDRDQTSNEHLRGLLHPRFEVTVAPLVDEAWRELEKEPFSLVIGDFEIFRDSGRNIPGEIRSRSPETRIALISRLDTEHYLSCLNDWQCYHVLPKLPFYNACDVLLFIENILDPTNAFGLARYLSMDAEWSRVRIHNRTEKNKTVEEIINFFASCEYEIHELYDVRLIMEEIINNAIFHAFLDEEGNQKYHSEKFDDLDSSEEVWIEFGSDATTIGFSVTDNRGALGPDHIIQKLHRQYNREGLYDESGRGLYLSRILSGNMIFNINRGKNTQIVILFYEKRLNVPKPFSINYQE